jgi:hypothetical protein
MALGTHPRAWRRSRIAATVAAAALLAAPVAGCGGGTNDEIEPATPTITVRILENQPERVPATRENPAQARVERIAASIR